MLWWILVGCGSSGSFDALTYNVAGLPAALSSSDPEVNIPQMAAHLEAYDLVLVQEDFAYHPELVADLTHPFLSDPAIPMVELVNDGLNRFARHPFESLERSRWADCNGLLDQGSDCLSEKGFSVADHEIADGVRLTVANHHADAGSSDGDIEARASNFAQLAARLAQVEGAVLVAGDTNLRPEERPGDSTTFSTFVDDADLQDVCTFLSCGENEIDRFYFRSGPDLDLVPSAWRFDDAFVDANGDPLSDHPAIAITLSWARQ